MKSVDTITIHHSASSRDGTTLEDIKAWHTDPRKPGGPFDAIGYHFVIEGTGRLRYGRHVREVGAHSRPNARRLGVCVTGDNTIHEERWNSNQLATLRLLVSALETVFPSLVIEGHRDQQVPGYTECPGLVVADLNL